MGSSRQKGDRRERQARDIYEAAGYEAERATAGGFQSPDFYDLYDLLAIKPEHGMHMVQVKANRAEGIEQWAVDVQPHYRTPSLWPVMLVCYDREGWRMIIPLDDGEYSTVHDERETDGAMGDTLTDYLAQARTW